jgi:hypothetical protein
MEKAGTFAFMRTTLAAFAVLTMAACTNQGPNPRAANIVPPPPPPNPLQQQAPQQQAGPPAQIAQMQQQNQPQNQQQAQPQQRGAARAPAGNLVMGGHLESHKSMEGAEAAWQSLVRKQPALQQLRPYFVPVMVRGEPWVRLLAGDFPDRNEVNQFCNWARAQKMYCAPMPLAGASLENPASITGGSAAPSNAAPRQQPQRQPRGTPQSGDAGTLQVPAPVAAPPPVAPPVAAAPALVAPAPNATPPQPLAPPLPPRRQATNPTLPQ